MTDRKPPSPPWLTALWLWLAASLAFALRDNLTSNELDTLQTARRLADPSYLAGDWFLRLPQGPRRPFQVLVWPLVQGLSLPIASVVGRLLGFALVAMGVARLANRLRIGPMPTLGLGAVFVWLGQSVAGGEWLIGQFESKVVAYALVFFALDAWLGGRRVPAGALLGGATTVHVLVGGQATLALGLVALVERPIPWRTYAKVALAWVILAAPGVAILLTAATGRVASDPPVSWIYVVFRTPHHSDPTTWTLSWRTYAWAGGLLLALGLLPRRRPDRPEWRVLALFTFATLVPFALGLVAAHLPGGHKFLQLLPFRVGSLMWVVLGLLVVGSALAERVPVERLPRRLPTVLGLLLGGWVLWHAATAIDLQTWRDFPEGGRPALPRPEGLALTDAARWIRDHTPPHDLVLASPTHESVGYLAQRPVVATYKQTPPGHAEVVAWYHRLRDLAGGTLPPARGHALLPALDAHFERLPPAAYLDLARRYHGRWLLVRRTDLPWPPAYRNDVWSVFELPR